MKINYGTEGNLPTGIQRDQDYDWVPPLRDRLIQTPNVPRGRQCGECGVKFDYGVGYGYACPSNKCPMGLR